LAFFFSWIYVLLKNSIFSIENFIFDFCIEIFKIEISV